MLLRPQPTLICPRFLDLFHVQAQSPKITKNAKFTASSGNWNPLWQFLHIQMDALKKQLSHLHKQRLHMISGDAAKNPLRGYWHVTFSFQLLLFK